MSAPGHYLMLLLEVKDGLKRVYFALASEQETLEEATDRWVQSRLAGRKRNRAKAENALYATILSAKFCRPTSWHRQQAEAAGLPFPVPPRRARKAVRAR